MSAQRKQRPATPRANPDRPEHASTRGQDDWKKTQGGRKAAENPHHDEVQQQNQDSWNVHQHPEYPERPADGGRTEMRGNGAKSESQSGNAESSERPESADRHRNPRTKRRSES